MLLEIYEFLDLPSKTLVFDMKSLFYLSICLIFARIHRTMLDLLSKTIVSYKKLLFFYIKL